MEWKGNWEKIIVKMTETKPHDPVSKWIPRKQDFGGEIEREKEIEIGREINIVT